MKGQEIERKQTFEGFWERDRKHHLRKVIQPVQLLMLQEQKTSKIRIYILVSLFVRSEPCQ